jgi:hypothetical protein
MDPTSALSAASAGSDIGIAMLKKVLDDSSITVLKLLNTSLDASVGKNLDVRA